MTRETALSIKRILRVNHAGEYGAIRIYGAQIAVSKLLWPDMVAPLRELHSHEVQHCHLFKTAMPARGSRPCRAMWLWSVGGWKLGAFTALMGRKAIWACTEIVEAKVHEHLDDQIHFLQGKDDDLADLIRSIQVEEEGHLKLAQDNRGPARAVDRLLEPIIALSVNAVIWLSTWGESTKMHRDMAGVQT